jgi:hypothetical protein
MSWKLVSAFMPGLCPLAQGCVECLRAWKRVACRGAPNAIFETSSAMARDTAPSCAPGSAADARHRG